MILLCTEIKNFWSWLTGMKKLTFHFINIFGWGLAEVLLKCVFNMYVLTYAFDMY